MKLDADVRSTLGRLPPKLEQLYLEIYEKRIISYPGEAGRSTLGNALRWLLCSQRQMKSSEFCLAVAMNLTASPGGLTIEHILELCHNFVVYDHGLDTFRFAHLSVREFLEKLPEYSQNSCHVLAAEICLLQLVASSKSLAAEHFLRDEYNDDIRSKSASTAEAISGGFHKYATLFWMVHCQMSGEDKRKSNKRFENMFHFFLFDDSGTSSPLNTWLLSYRRRVVQPGVLFYLRNMLSWTSRSLVRCFFLASAYGFCEILRACLKKGGLGEERQEGLGIAAWNGQDEAFKLLLGHMVNQKMTELSIIRATSLTEETLAWCLDRGSNINLTADIVAAAAGRKGVGILKIILDNCKNTGVTKEMLKAAASCAGGSAFSMLLARANEADVFEELLQDAASANSTEVMILLLDRFGNSCITTEVMRTAAIWGSESIMQLLLDRGGASKLTPKIIQGDAEAGRIWAMRPLLDQGYRIPQTSLIAAAASCSASTLQLLLEQLKGSGGITQQVLTQMMKSAASNTFYGPIVMRQLLERAGKMKITEEVLMTVAHNHTTGNELMRILIDEDREVELTEEVLEAAIEFLDLDEIMLFLVERVKAKGITRKVLKAAARNTRFGDELLKLLTENAKDVEILEPLMACAARNYGCGAEVMLLLEDRLGELKITDTVLVAAASNGGPQTMKFLLDRIEIAMVTEEVIVKATNNYRLGRSDDGVSLRMEKAIDLPITDKMLQSAARSGSRDALPLLWSRSPRSKISGDLALAAADSLEPLKAFTFLLDQTKDIEMGEEAIMALIKRQYHSEAIFNFLLGRDVQMEITENVLKAAAAMPHRSSRMLPLLLQHTHKAQVTEDVFKVTAASGLDKNLHVLSAYCGLDTIPEKVSSLARLRHAVFDCADFDGEIDLVKKLAGQGVEVDVPDGQGRTLLSHATAGGHELVVRALLSFGADPNHQDEEGETPIFNAARYASSEIVKILMAAGADPDSKDGEGLTPLFIAASRGDYDIVEILLDAGVLSQLEDINGRTPSSLALDSGHMRVYRRLEKCRR